LTAYTLAIGDTVASAITGVKPQVAGALYSIAAPSYAVPEEVRTSWNALRCLVEGRVVSSEDPPLSASMGWALRSLVEDVATKK
jgi:hypothetical protein